MRHTRRVSAARLVKRVSGTCYDAIASGRAAPDGSIDAGATSHARKSPRGAGSRQVPHQEGAGQASAGARSTARSAGAHRAARDPRQRGPQPAKPSWADFVESLSPRRARARPGDAPRDWMDDCRGFGGDGAEKAQSAESASHEQEAAESLSNDKNDESARRRPGRNRAGAPSYPRWRDPNRRNRAGAVEVTPVTGPLRYGVQFSAEEEYVQLVERAKALLSHAHSKSTLEEIHLRAMRLLVADLEKRRFEETPRPRKRRASRQA